MKKIMVSLMAAMFVLGLAGCNTLAGVGEDIQSAGEKIEDAARKDR